MAESAPVLPGLSPVAGRPVRAAFDGGRLTSDAGVLVLAEIERRLGLAERLARCLADPRDPERVHHTIAEMIRFRVLLIAAGYPDANDCDALRADPAFKLALGRLPESGPDLCSQPTMSRLENLPGPTALKRMMAAMVELFCDSFTDVPRRIVLDIDDTEDRVHGRQQLARFHAHYDGRCFLPIHVYEALTGKPVAAILRPGKTPDGAEVARVVRHVVRAIRARWPRVEILIRGDSHYARPEAMSWCERHRVGYVFGLAGNKVLLARIAALAEDAALGRVAGEGAKVRRYGEFAYAAGTWAAERRVIARVEASDRGADSRFIVTNLAGAPRWLYATVYCARGRADIYQTSCVPRVGLGRWWQAGRSARSAGRAQRPQALQLLGIGGDQPNGPPLIGRRAACGQQAAPEPAVDRLVGHLQAHRQFQERQLRRSSPRDRTRWRMPGLGPDTLPAE